jgi:predicted CopG family antitoxin
VARTQRKTRRTFSLSHEAVRYLESVRKGKRARSISSVLEELIRKRQEGDEMDRISASIAGYYDSLTDDQVAQDSSWGKFSEAQLPIEK